MVSFLERIFCTTERISYFSTRKRQRLSNSLSISSISLRPFLSFSRYSFMNCFIISSQNTFARHQEAPRITTARSLVESVESSRCASIIFISTSSHEGFSTPMALFFSPHPHDALCGWKELCRVWCIRVYLARPWACCQDCVFCPVEEFGENDFIALHGQDLCYEDWATPEPKDCGHPLCCSFPICVFVHSISCWFGNYLLHFAPVLCLVLSLRFICEKETAVQDPSKVLQLPFRRLYHKLANHLTLETPPPRCFLLILPLFLRKAPSFGKRTETPLFKYNLFFARVGVQELAKVFVCRTDVVREMTSKWVLDLARFEL